jgi:acyl carrier protein
MNDPIANARERLHSIFRTVFGDDSIVLQDDMTAANFAGWDSLTNINLIIACEREFGIRFATAEISRLKADDQDIGSLLRLIAAKVGRR